MATIHPHWEATESESDTSRGTRDMGHETSDLKSQVQSLKSRTVSRKPAAILGILIALSVGAVALQNTASLPGQLMKGSVIIKITQTGFDPKSITVKPGETITWMNETTIPHILASQTLMGADGQPLATSPIFPGASFDLLIPNAAAGKHDYISQTDVIAGDITIETFQPEPLTQAPPQGLTLPTQPDQPPPAQTTEQGTAATAIPKNPHTVDSTPLPPLTGNATAKEAPPQKAPVTPSYKKPIATPATGPGLWMVSLLSIAMLLFVTRRAFRRANI